MDQPLNRIGVIGAGTMGAGIAQVGVLAGLSAAGHLGRKSGRGFYAY